MSDAIIFENISKQYRLGLVSTQTISHDLKRWWVTNVLGKEDPYLKIGEVNDRAHKGTSDYVWALKDINFRVEQGDVLGIIGKNGAGKSTLLKILSKVTTPTTGEIKARGRIASLLEVGTGFHPEMTGRENIYMNGAIMGMSKAEITRKLDEIIDFSGVERYIDTPAKRYSSGMTVRLGFAIAAHLEPEILVVDEVLAVGDAEFQKKAIGKMQDVSKGEGRTVLFVSHNMTAVRNLCKTGLLMSNGQIEFRGEVTEVIDYYLGKYAEETKSLYFSDISTALGNESIRIRSFRLMPLVGDFILVDSGIKITMELFCNKENFIFDISYELSTIEEILILGDSGIVENVNEVKKGFYEFELIIPPYFLNSGKYRIEFWFGENFKHLLWQMPPQIFSVQESFDRKSPGLLRTSFEKRINFLGQAK